MISKIRKTFLKGKGKHISMVGRVSIIEYVLSSMPIFLLSVLKLLQNVSKQLLKFRECFYEVGEERVGKLLG